jgi:hypothetical protein
VEKAPLQNMLLVFIIRDVFVWARESRLVSFLFSPFAPMLLLTFSVVKRQEEHIGDSSHGSWSLSGRTDSLAEVMGIDWRRHLSREAFCPHLAIL